MTKNRDFLNTWSEELQDGSQIQGQRMRLDPGYIATDDDDDA